MGNGLRADDRARARRGRGTRVGGPTQIEANLDGLIYKKRPLALLIETRFVSLPRRNVARTHETATRCDRQAQFWSLWRNARPPSKAREISCFPPPSSIEASSPTVSGAVPNHSPPERAITHRHAPVIRTVECRKA